MEMAEKSQLPVYSPLPSNTHSAPLIRHRQRGIRRSRIIKYFGLCCLAFILLAQWRQIRTSESRAPKLSLDRLNDDLQTCKKLRLKPKDPVGLGRHKNARAVAGSKPTLIKNALIWVGEPLEGTSPEDARAGKGWEWVHGDVFFEHGLIKTVQSSLSLSSLPKDTNVYEANGRLLTAGLIDMHSHAGVFALPSLSGNMDGNEMSDNITPWARSIDALMPLDPQIRVIKSGGVTTSLILPGSANNIAGEAYVVKHAVGKQDGRKELSAVDMLADPDRNWRYMKMACGENPKRVHGSLNSRPFTRMGESYEFRHALEQAREMNQRQDDWCAKAEAHGIESMEEYLPQEIAWDALGAVLRGQVHINTHCYTIPDLEAMVDHTNEFKFPIRAFHHAHQTYLVPEILKRTWGGRPPAAAIFADNMYYKVEAYIGSPFAGKYLYNDGITPIYVSDNPVISAQHVVFEAAKGHHYGLPYHAALASLTTAPADYLGFGQRLGKIKPGYDADIVVWDSDPLSVGATPVQVWIDGTVQFEDPIVLNKTNLGPLHPGPNKADLKMLDELEEESGAETTADALFKGVSKVLLHDKIYEVDNEPVNVAVLNGKISCIGSCKEEFQKATASGVKVFELQNGYLHEAFVGVAGTLGLNEIDAEDDTDNGPNPVNFSRGLDGLRLDGKKLSAAFKAGVTRAISAPTFTGGGSHHGTSVGFVTNALNSLQDGAVFADDVAVHYTLDNNVHDVKTSLSAAFGALRDKLLKLASNKQDVRPFSEDSYLQDVLDGQRTLALTINNADAIATALRIKQDVEHFISSKIIKMAIIGGAESHIVADELAAAKVGVILTPLQATPEAWDTRRSLSGAPLTNGTTIDKLIDAGVQVGIGLKEDWEVRDLGFVAGKAWRNSEGRLDEKGALDLVSRNLYGILGMEVKSGKESGHFVISEGSPLEVSSRVVAVGSGQVTIFN